MSSKSRFSSLDVRRAVSDLRGKVLGLRVANVYDLNKKTYLLKVVRPDLKAFIVIESGVRLHSTIYSRDKSDVPSIFAMKVRVPVIFSPSDVTYVDKTNQSQLYLNR